MTIKQSEAKTMTTPFKDTPVLYGEDARRFEENMRKAEQNRASQAEHHRIMAVYRRVRIIDRQDDRNRHDEMTGA